MKLIPIIPINKRWHLAGLKQNNCDKKPPITGKKEHVQKEKCKNIWIQSFP